MIITGTIVTTALTVYVIEFMDNTSAINIEQIENITSSYIYQKNAETKEYELVYYAKPDNNEVHLATEIDKIPQHVLDAFIYTEDKQFYNHNGVDFKRTFVAFANELTKAFSSGRQGGSTIPQQLIKNVTGDDKQTWDRKLREIFNAMHLEKKYTKDDILMAYLNYIPFGQSEENYNIYGVKAASIAFFGKEPADLTIAEAATLAAIPKATSTYNPLKNFESNQIRAKGYVLMQMFDNGVISPIEYEEALSEQILVVNSPGFSEKYPNRLRLNPDDGFKNPEVTTYAIDAAIYEIADYIAAEKEISWSDAKDDFMNGGYTLYLTVDTGMQNYVEAKYADRSSVWKGQGGTHTYTRGGETYKEQLQSGFVAMDYNGRILCAVGGIGEKTESLSLNRATRVTRSVGSTIKPVSSYGYALENDVITWSSVYKDTPLTVDGQKWPSNYTEAGRGGWSNSAMKVYDALRYSKNTIPAQIVNNAGTQTVFDFCTKKLHLKLLDYVTLDDGSVRSDITLSALAVGGMTYGIPLANLANAYMPYGNGGLYYKSHIIGKIIDSTTGNVIFDDEKQAPEQAVSAETAYVMNKLLQKVISDSGSTGTAARLSKKTVVGKTGTSSDWWDIVFVGLTEDFVSAIWMGYDNNAEYHGNSAAMWKKVIGDYANNLDTGAKYPENENVIAARFCTASNGLIASSSCPHKSGAVGYFKSTNAHYCNH